MVIISHNESRKIPDNFYRHHREGVWSCPYCDWQDEHRHMDKWYDKYHVEELIFGYWYGKVTGFIIVSTCPSCGELSWLHEDYSYGARHLENHPELIKVIEEESNKRKDYVKDLWERGPCRKCKYLRKDKTEIQDYYIHKECGEDGWSISGPPIETKKDCAHLTKSRGK